MPHEHTIRSASAERPSDWRKLIRWWGSSLRWLALAGCAVVLTVAGVIVGGWEGNTDSSRDNHIVWTSRWTSGISTASDSRKVDQVDALDWLGSDPLGSFRFMAMVDWTARVEALPEPSPTSDNQTGEQRVLRVPDSNRAPLAQHSGDNNWSALVCNPPFTWDCGWALATIFCESGGNPNAVGIEYVNGVYTEFHGLFQVTWGPFDPYLNAVEAHIQFHEWMRGERGRPWPNCP